MKTQINDLVQGSQFVAGTPQEIKAERFKKVVAENPDCLRIEIKGVEIKLRINVTLSGKTIGYIKDLSLEEAINLRLYPDEPEFKERYGKKYIITLSVDSHAIVWTTAFGRKNERCQWRFRYNRNIENKYAKILN